MRFDRTLFTQTRLLSQAINVDHLTRAFELHRLDYEAAHEPGGGPETNVSGGGTTDPTASAAARRKPPADTKWHHAWHDYIKAVTTLHEFAKQGETNPRLRADIGSPCGGGQHNNHGTWEPCTGQLAPGVDRCPRCELHRTHWICRSCGEVKRRGQDPNRNGLDDKCRKRDERTEPMKAILKK